MAWGFFFLFKAMQIPARGEAPRRLNQSCATRLLLQSHDTHTTQTRAPENHNWHRGPAGILTLIDLEALEESHSASVCSAGLHSSTHLA